MIHDPARLAEVIDEIIDWTLEQRRSYIANLERAFGPAAAQQIRDALTERWNQ
ncbi:hypothetical protein AB4Y43_01195 [Paraburkholderia sp. BR10872]|uniref:hypothetical protein n=1 Tax=Paraburkholderia sp. BR10872 TaxID=3236989 RepID=UPI0034D29461